MNKIVKEILQALSDEPKNIYKTALFFSPKTAEFYYNDALVDATECQKMIESGDLKFDRVVRHQGEMMLAYTNYYSLTEATYCYDLEYCREQNQWHYNPSRINTEVEGWETIATKQSDHKLSLFIATTNHFEADKIPTKEHLCDLFNYFSYIYENQATLEATPLDII